MDVDWASADNDEEWEEESYRSLENQSCARSEASSRQKERRVRRQAKNGNKRKHQNSLDHMRARVSELLAIFEGQGRFIPPPEMAKGKIWSNRSYGQDKKRQRKATERTFLQQRIAQLEACLFDNESSK